MTVAVGIVAHVKRTDQAEQLMRDVEATFLGLDGGVLGCSGNHRRVWHDLAKNTDAEYCCVLEDDALPVNDFRAQLDAVIEASPSPIISLYLGRKRPPHMQWMIEPAIKLADAKQAHFIVSRTVLHAVALVIRRDLVDDMLDNIDPALPIDDAISAWIQQRRYRIAYTLPSLVDHADGDTLLAHPDGEQREKGRVAWRYGRRDAWENNIVEMN